MFKLGKFFEIFAEDALICNKLLDLNWMGCKTKLHVGFPEASLTKYSKVLVDHGYRVCVVEQIEDEEDTPKGKGSKLDRKVVAILSKGLFSLEGSERDQQLMSYET